MQILWRQGELDNDIYAIVRVDNILNWEDYRDNNDGKWVTEDERYNDRSRVGLRGIRMEKNHKKVALETNRKYAYNI